MASIFLVTKTVSGAIMILAPIIHPSFKTTFLINKNFPIAIEIIIRDPYRRINSFPISIK
ncbi:MAG: hypothetical protein ACFFAN_01435 [Promethearchaeota archaeon]